MARIDDELDPDTPKVRPLRMILASVFGLAGTVAAVFGLWYVRSHRPEPQGSAAVVGQSVASVIAWGVLLVGSLVAVVATVTLILALREAHAARGAGDDESG